MGFWTDLLIEILAPPKPKSSKKVPIYISCPACIDEGHWTPKSYLLHANCSYSNNYLYLTENADVYCSGCELESHISKWAFQCGSGRHKYRIPSTPALSTAISTSGQMVTEGGQRWLINVLERM